MKLITELNETVNYITEETDDKGKKKYSIEGVFLQANVKNRNGRVYPQNILKNEVDRYVKEYVQKNRAYGELGHPQGPTINLERVSHMITDLKEDGSNFVGKAKIMDTPYGDIVKNLMKEGATLGVSSRGMGSLREKNGVMEVQKDFYLATAADIVADPSAPDAFVQGIMEGKEFVWDNGVLREVDIAEAKKKLDKCGRLSDEMAVKIFENFLSKI